MKARVASTMHPLWDWVFPSLFKQAWLSPIPTRRSLLMFVLNSSVKHSLVRFKLVITSFMTASWWSCAICWRTGSLKPSVQLDTSTGKQAPAWKSKPSHSTTSFAETMELEDRDHHWQKVVVNIEHIMSLFATEQARSCSSLLTSTTLSI